MEMYHYIFGFTIFLYGLSFSQSDKPSGLSQGDTLVKPCYGRTQGLFTWSNFVRQLIRSTTIGSDKIRSFGQTFSITILILEYNCLHAIKTAISDKFHANVPLPYMLSGDNP
jgi:hypothetical protein